MFCIDCLNEFRRNLQLSQVCPLISHIGRKSIQQLIAADKAVLGYVVLKRLGTFLVRDHSFNISVVGPPGPCGLRRTVRNLLRSSAGVVSWGGCIFWIAHMDTPAPEQM